MKAIDDPELAATVEAYDEPVSASRLRQYLFSEAFYLQLLAYRTGTLNWEGLHGRARLLLRTPSFANIGKPVATNAPACTTHPDESRVGRMIDSLARDMDEANTEEWWVMGSPPEEHG